VRVADPCKGFASMASRDGPDIADGEGRFVAWQRTGWCEHDDGSLRASPTLSGSRCAAIRRGGARKLHATGTIPLLATTNTVVEEGGVRGAEVGAYRRERIARFGYVCWVAMPRKQ